MIHHLQISQAIIHYLVRQNIFCVIELEVCVIKLEVCVIHFTKAIKSDVKKKFCDPLFLSD